jgi:hypothetical protein
MNYRVTDMNDGRVIAKGSLPHCERIMERWMKRKEQYRLLLEVYTGHDWIVWIGTWIN